jgi:outer membrane protein assembly factor BamB
MSLNNIKNIVTPSLPSDITAKSFPQSWSMYAGGQDHNAAFSIDSDAPDWMKKGVEWKFAEMNALPLTAEFADLNQLGTKSAPVKETQFLGNSIGVSVVKGIVYSESDDRYLYALDAKTGKLLWQQGPLVNVLMGNPVVANDLVYVTAGDTGFSLEQLMKNQQSGGKASLVRGLGYSALYAFDAKTGKQVWRQDFNGEAMPSPVVDGNNLYIATGDNYMYKFNAATGELIWKLDLGGFDSMSSLNIYHQDGKTYVIVGTSMKNNEIAVDGDTGKIVWSQPTDLNVFLTGMGDNSPSVDQEKGIVVFDTVVDASSNSINMAVAALDAATGKQLWTTKLGEGSNPPAYKVGVTMIHDGAVYAGSPATGKYYKLDEKTGKILWQTSAPLDTGAAGTGRGSAAFANGVLWLTQGAYIIAVDPNNGNILSKYSSGGRYGMVNPVIVGNTLYADNTYDWVMAVPLNKIYHELNRK